jgi:peptidoglycan/xylan/chitin deacetylase (PgdA/CDA1 family)
VSRSRALVLCYHAISDTWHDWLGLPRADFSRQLGLFAPFFRSGTLAEDGRPLTIPELSGERYDAEALATLTWDELRGLAGRNVEIGSHTITHAHLPQLGDAELDRELSESRERIADELGRPCRFLAYPYGEQDERVREAARRAGYEAAFGLPGRGGERFALPRVGIYRGSPLWRVAAKAALRPR